MKKIALALAVPLALGAAFPAPAAAEKVVRTLDKRLSAEGATGVHVDVPVGGLQLQATDASEVRAEVRLSCKSERRTSCVEAAERMELVVARSGGRIEVELKKWPRGNNRGLEVHAEVEIPRDLLLSADLGVGEIVVDGFENDVRVDLGVGEARLTLPEAAVRSVDLDTGIGESNLRHSGGRVESAGFLSKEIDWDRGPGRAKVQVDCGVGEIDVKLVGAGGVSPARSR